MSKRKLSRLRPIDRSSASVRGGRRKSQSDDSADLGDLEAGVTAYSEVLGCLWFLWHQHAASGSKEALEMPPIPDASVPVYPKGVSSFPTVCPLFMPLEMPPIP